MSNRYPMSIVQKDMGLPSKPGEDICEALIRRRAKLMQPAVQQSNS